MTTRWPVERLRRIVGRVELENVTLVHAEVQGMPSEGFDPSGYEIRWLTRVFGRDAEIGEEDGQVQLDGAFEVQAIFEYSHRENEDEGDAVAQDPGATPDEEVTRSADGEAGNGSGLRAFIRAAFLLEYALQPQDGEDASGEEWDAADLVAFAEFNTPLNVWPYWREFVQSMTQRMGLPAVTVEVLRGPDLASLRKRED